MNMCLGELPTAGDDDPKKAAEDGSITREQLLRLLSGHQDEVEALHPKKPAKNDGITREEVLRLLGAHQEEVEALQAEVARLAAREPGGGDDDRPDAECLEEMLDAEGEGFTGLPVDRLYEKADESYFFRVQCMVMYNGFDRWTTFHFLFVVFVVAMQIGALQTVWQSVWLVTDFSQWVGADDPDFVGEYYPIGVPRPTDYWALLEHYDSHKVYGVLFIVVFPLVFTCVCVTISLRAEMEEWKAGYVLFRRELRNFYDNRAAADGKPADDGAPLRRRPSASEVNAAVPRPRLFRRLAACLFTHYVRASIVWYFIDGSAMVLGTADGPFNLLLNAVALVYILDIDDLLRLDMPSNNFFGVEDAAQRKRYRARNRQARAVFREVVKAVRAAPTRLLDAYHGVGWLSPVCICLALFHMSARFQRHTQRGRLVSADDDSWRGATHASLTASYNYTMYAVLIVLLVDAQLAAYVSLADEARGSWRPLAEAAAWFLVDGLVLALIRQIALRYAVHCLLPYTMSEETWPMRFWKRLDPTPNRPNEQSYYAYDYDGATDDAYS